MLIEKCIAILSNWLYAAAVIHKPAKLEGLKIHAGQKF